MPGPGVNNATSPRYARQMLLPGWDQARLADSTVVVLGVGALGNAVVQSLALAGVGRLILSDPDKVEVSNLPRCPLFRPSHIGRKKVEAAAETLADIAPATLVSPRPGGLENSVGLAELRDASLVLGCLDSRVARLELTGRCGLVRAAWIDGATGSWDGEIRSYLDPDGPCYGCGQPTEALTIDDMPQSCGLPPSEAHAGAAAPLSATVGAHMALAAVRFLMGLPTVGTGPDPTTILELNAALGEVARLRQDRDPACPFHRPIPAAARIPIGSSDTVGALRAALGPNRSALAWTPIVTEAVCPACGWTTGRSMALSDLATCPRCDAVPRRRTTLELDAIHGNAVLMDVGIPSGEILAARHPGGMQFYELNKAGEL